MEWTALWLGSLLERLKPGLGNRVVRTQVRNVQLWCMSSAMSAKGNHPAWAWALGVVIPAVFVQFVLSDWDSWLGWLLQATFIYGLMGWGSFTDSDGDPQMAPPCDSDASEPPSHGLHPMAAQTVLHQVLAPLIALLLGQLIGLPWFALVACVLAREWHGTMTAPEGRAWSASIQWSTQVWGWIDAVATRLALLVLALVGRFDAVFEVWLDQAPRWRDSHQALWQRGLAVAMRADASDAAFERRDKQNLLVARAVLALVGVNTLVAWL